MNVLLLLLLSSFCQAETYRIEGNEVRFELRNELLLSRCEKNCDALKAVLAHPKLSRSAIRKGKKYVSSVGSDICADVYKGASVLGVDEKKNQKAFCYFRDGSLIEINSLSKYLEKKVLR